MLGEAKRKLCNCKNSRCLKLYCECFASGVYCDGCNCIGCCNNPACDDVRRIAIEATLERNPTAFRPKIAKTTTHSAHLGAAGGGAPAVRHNKGCHCKKSSCLKKYCECFQAGIVCSQMCKCVDCRNFEGSAELASLALNAHVAPTAPSGAAGACASPFHAGRCSPSPMQRGGDSARPSPNTGVKRPRSADRGKGDMTPGAHTGGAVRAGTGGGAPSGCPSGCPTPARADATDAAGALATAASLVQSAAFGIGVARAASPAVGASACGQCGTAAAAAAAAAAAMAMASPARLGRQDAPGASPFPPPLGVSGGLLALSGTAGGATRCAGAGAMGAPVASGGGSGSSGGGGGSAALCSAFTQHRLLVAAEMMLRAALGAVASGQPQLNAPRPAASAAQPAAHAGSGAPCAPPARPPATADAPRGSVCNGHDGACSRTPSASPSCFALLCDEETPTVTAAAATDTAAAAAADQDGAAARGVPGAPACVSAQQAKAPDGDGDGDVDGDVTAAPLAARLDGPNGSNDGGGGCDIDGDVAVAMAVAVAPDNDARAAATQPAQGAGASCSAAARSRLPPLGYAQAAMAAAMAVGDGCMEADCVTGGGAAGWLADRSAHLDQIYAAQERAVLAELNATLRTLAAHARRKVGRAHAAFAQTAGMAGSQRAGGGPSPGPGSSSGRGTPPPPPPLPPAATAAAATAAAAAAGAAAARNGGDVPAEAAQQAPPHSLLARALPVSGVCEMASDAPTSAGRDTQLAAAAQRSALRPTAVRGAAPPPPCAPQPAQVVGAGGGCSGSGAGGGSGGAAQLQLPPRASPCAASPPAPPAPSPARGAPGARPPCGTPCRSAQPAPPTAIAALGAAAAPCARPAASCVREPVPVAAAPLAPCGQLARAAPAETPPLLSPVEERRERGGEAVPAAIARLPVHAVQQQQLARPQPQRTQPPPVQQPLAQPPDDALVPRTAGAPLPAPALPRMSPPGAPAAMRSVRQALPPETATNGAASGQTGAPGLVRLEQQGQRQPMAAAAEVTALPAAATAAVFAPTPMPMVAPGAASARALAMAASLHCAPPPGPHSATG